MAYEKKPYQQQQFEPKVTAKGTKLQLMNLQGKAYMPVNQRLVWFREEHPNGVISTEPVRIEENFAIFKATIAVPNSATGQHTLIATGFKKETQAGFADFIEKAETGAIGRALALAGFGTQFETGFEEGDRLADAPVEVIGKGKSNEGSKNAQGQSPVSPTGGKPVSSVAGAGNSSGPANNQPQGVQPAPLNTSPAAPLPSQPKPSGKKTPLAEKAKSRADVNNLLSSVSRSIIAKKLLSIDQIKGYMVTTYGSDDKGKLDDGQATELLSYLDGLNNGLSNGVAASA